MPVLSMVWPCVECSTQAISPKGAPNFLSSDNDPLFRYHRWQVNLRIMDIQEIKTVPYVPYHTATLNDSSEPFVVNTLITSSFGILKTVSENS